MTKVMLKMIGLFSEMERKIIFKCVKDGMGNAKAKGSVSSTPKLEFENIQGIVIRHFVKLDIYSNGGEIYAISVEAYARLYGYSRQMIYRYIKAIDKYYLK